MTYHITTNEDRGAWAWALRRDDEIVFSGRCATRGDARDAAQSCAAGLSRRLAALCGNGREANRPPCLQDWMPEEGT